MLYQIIDKRRMYSEEDRKLHLVQANSTMGALGCGLHLGGRGLEVLTSEGTADDHNVEIYAVRYECGLLVERRESEYYNVQCDWCLDAA